MNIFHLSTFIYCLISIGTSVFLGELDQKYFRTKLPMSSYRSYFLTFSSNFFYRMRKESYVIEGDLKYVCFLIAGDFVAIKQQTCFKYI